MASPSGILAHPAANQFARFVVVGVINTAFGYGVFAALIVLNVPSGPALFFSTALGVLFNYMTTGRLVFRWHNAGRLLPFIGVYGAIYGVNVSALWTLEAWGVQTLIAQAALLPVMVIVSYVLNRFLVFRPIAGEDRT